MKEVTGVWKWKESSNWKKTYVLYILARNSEFSTPNFVLKSGFLLVFVSKSWKQFQNDPNCTKIVQKRGKKALNKGLLQKALESFLLRAWHAFRSKKWSFSPLFCPILVQIGLKSCKKKRKKACFWQKGSAPKSVILSFFLVFFPFFC